MCVCREEVKEQLEKKKKGSKALAEFEDQMHGVGSEHPTQGSPLLQGQPLEGGPWRFCLQPHL